MSDNVIAQGLRSVAIGHDVINSIIVTGDHNRFFIGDYVRLKDAYIAPWPVFERVNLRRFTGREWLLAEVDAFLSRQDRGYFVLEAEAGLGKTTFLAWLVQQRGYIHHFVELAPGQEGIDSGLKNLGAQLVLNYHLEAWAAEGVLPGYAGRSQYLTKLLGLAAETRQEGEKIVLVVDALDEAGTPPGGNVLGLPQVLPEGVYVIASQRPVAVTLRVDSASTPRRVLPLVAGSAENQADMRRYLEGVATWPGIIKLLHESAYSAEQFVTTLLNKCQGLWIYLHYVVHEIENGDRTPLELDKLPEGMTQYYASYWTQWRDKDEMAWYGAYLPLLATLAGAQEAVSAERLLAWTGVSLEPPRLERLLNERWRPFMAFSETGGVRWYRFYHATLAEFFVGQIDRTKLNAVELAMVEELAKRTREAHSRLADRYLAAWGGLAAELPGLREEGKRDLDDGYGLRHLARHLASAQRWDELHVLVAEGNGDHQPWGEARQRPDVSQSGYLADLALAWDEAYRMVQAQEDPTQSSRALVRCLQYTLISSSINSLSGRYDPELIGRAVEIGYWSAGQALAVAEHVSAPWLRCRMYQHILAAGNLTVAEHEQAQDEGLAAMRAIDDTTYRLEALAGLAPHLTGEARTRALRSGLADVLTDFDFTERAHPMKILAPHLTGDLAREGLEMARNMYQVQRSEVLEKLAPNLGPDLLDQGLAIARAEEIPKYRAEAVVAMAQQLRGDARQQVMAAELAAAEAVELPWFRADALAALAPALSGDLLEPGLAAALALESYSDRCKVLVRLAPLLTGNLAKVALAAAQDLGYLSGEVLEALAPNLMGELAQEGLTAALAIRNAPRRGDILVALVPQLTGEAREIALREGLAGAQAEEKITFRAEELDMQALAAPAPHLDGDDVGQLLAAGQVIHDENSYARALVSLISYCAGEARGQVLAAALQATQVDEYEWDEDGANLMLQLLAQLSGKLKEDALAVALDRNKFGSVEFWVALLPDLRGNVRERALSAALEKALPRYNSSDEQNKALEVLVPYLSDELLAQALDATLAISHWPDERHLVANLAALAPRLTGHLLITGLEAALAVEKERERVTAVVAFAPQLTGDLLAKALSAAQTMAVCYRARIVVALASQLTSEAAEEALADALAAVQAAERSWERSKGMMVLAPYLTDEQLSTAVLNALTSEDVVLKSEDLAVLAPKLTGEAREQALAAGLEAALAIDWEEDRTKVLAALAPQLTSELSAAALETSIEFEGYRADLLVALAPRLAGEALEAALQAASEIHWGHYRTRALKALAPHLAGDLLGGGLAATLATEDESYRVEILAALAPQLADNLVAQALAASQALEDEQCRAAALVALIPQLTSDQLAEVLAATKTMKTEGHRAEVLVAMTPRLSGDLLLQGLTAAKALTDLGQRALVLTEMMRRAQESEQECREARKVLADCLRDMLDYTDRPQVLSFCFEHPLFAPPVVVEQVMPDVARTVMNVERWWP